MPPLMHTLHSMISGDYFVLKSKDVKIFIRRLYLIFFLSRNVPYIVDFLKKEVNFDKYFVNDLEKAWKCCFV